MTAVRRSSPMGAVESVAGWGMCWLPLSAAPIGLKWRTTVSGSCDQLNLRTLQRVVRTATAAFVTGFALGPEKSIFTSLDIKGKRAWGDGETSCAKYRVSEGVTHSHLSDPFL
ncbi:hypothetical protein UY3_13358 [Chelonia mydas]|uniref:Uncharacterized protein n=1 Tax=Chelonia mydas TaxID=8469 RepID=M7BBL8_CHEMY|nr:hypothetical protein UY3_13358 [Chelonia mydas]